ncbi:hypothetical protein BX611_0224 [Lutibacter oceani]|uniref:Tetratricopeptide repeat protein n=1 Tax=Lutibacter oceani TaxID=1853311 RepID=A0A3D9RTZ8_9FLAO|nr:hypothetical protein [Lutibacter oceani]REE82948.1 hypothetical protein BX611_0224 [Lutibacter oceani]
MNNQDFTFLMQNIATIDALKTAQLDVVINEYPYFQLARAIQLKGLNQTNSFKYNQALKKTAAYTIDRSVLFDFITSQNFVYKTTGAEILEEIDVIEPETIKVLHKKLTDTYNQEKTQLIENEVKNLVEDNVLDSSTEIANEVLEIGKPIKFKSSEPHSFNEWMQLISQKPISRDQIAENNTKKTAKTSLIDKFIETNPKIKPIDKNTVNQHVTTESASENESLMTETLAKVYLEQQKFENAIKAYRILSLKYPEKSGFFADQIKAIKILQRNKS